MPIAPDFLIQNQPNLWIGHSNSIAYTITDYRLLSQTRIRHLFPNELGSVVPPTIIFTSGHVDMLTTKSGGESKCIARSTAHYIN